MLPRYPRVAKGSQGRQVDLLPFLLSAVSASLHHSINAHTTASRMNKPGHLVKAAHNATSKLLIPITSPSTSLTHFRLGTKHVHVSPDDPLFA